MGQDGAGMDGARWGGADPRGVAWGAAGLGGRDSAAGRGGVVRGGAGWGRS
jgi:hypothetical protein